MVTIAVVPDRLEGGLAWWAPGRSVTVEIGIGEHQGLIQIRPGGDFLLTVSKTGTPARGRQRPTILQIPGFPGAKQHKAIAAEFDHTDAWLQVTVPPSVASGDGQ